MKTRLATSLMACGAALLCARAQADTGKLLLTGSVRAIEGAAQVKVWQADQLVEVAP